MKSIPRKFILYLIPFVFFGCRHHAYIAPVRSFCYWKTTFKIDTVDAVNLKKLEVQHFYLRFFDVDWDAISKNTMPVAECEFSYNNEYLTDFTPTIFITNTVFENITESKIDELASHIAHKTSKMVDRLYNNSLESFISRSDQFKYLVKKFPESWSETDNYRDSMMQIIKPAFFNRNNEILIDCDWTPTTKNKYFKFLGILKAKMPGNEITSTLRLWQYRSYRLAGIPPVKRCLLMCYNLSDPRKYEKVNSIATYEEFQKYINHSVYPLHLDIALPIHSWAVYIRNAKFKGIVNGISQEEIAKNTDLFEPVANQRYKFLRDTVIGETYYRYGDEFRIEQVDLQTLLGFANILADHIKMDISSRISFFSWDAQFYNRFSKNEYNRIYKTISQ